METPLEAWLDEKRVFPPDPAFLARWKEGKIFEKASKNRLAFWETCAEELLWIKRWDQVLEWNPPFAKWFLGGELNVSANCLDRHVNSPRRHKAALIWEGEDGKRRVITYQELHEEVCRLADGLASLGVKKNDRVAIYLPLIPEAVAAMLAVARLGAVHTVVFGGFSSEALKDRIQDAEASVLITADGGYRKGGIVPLKAMADKAASECPSLHHVVVVKRTGHPIEMRPGRDVDYGELIKNASPRRPPESVRAEDPLFILYTSGTTGKPKGILHSSAGYLLGVHMTMQWVFDIKPEDLFWCTADIGWITGHSYVVYGPLSNGATVMLYEGAPDWPTRDRFWQIIEKERVTLFYTAPTAIRTFMKWGRQEIEKHDLSSLRLLGTVGEPINPEAWMWYYHHVGGSKCPIVDTWWQTETGSIMIAPLPGVTPLKPGSATKPLPGIQAAILNEKGEPSKAGFLAITEPWPSMLSGIYKDPERYKATYWSKWDGRYYFTGDGAKIDDEGNFWLLGRVDDVINVSGHRIGTMEVESALVDHPLVAESAVVGVSDEIKGQALAAFVVIKERALPSPALKEELIEHVAEKIGPIARPRDLYFCRDLPKTRSGKIMRRLLRDIGEKRILGDLTTLADPTVMDELKKMHEEDLNP